MIAQQAAATGVLIELCIMKYYGHAIAAHHHIQLNHFGAHLYRSPESGQGILRIVCTCPPMGYNDETVAIIVVQRRKLIGHVGSRLCRTSHESRHYN